MAFSFVLALFSARRDRLDQAGLRTRYDGDVG
jgi:hypothetical protein